MATSFISISKNKPISNIQDENASGKLYFSDHRIFLGTGISGGELDEYCVPRKYKKYDSDHTEDNGYYIASVSQDINGAITSVTKKLPLANIDSTANTFVDNTGTTITLKVNEETGNLYFAKYKTSVISLNQPVYSTSITKQASKYYNDESKKDEQIVCFINSTESSITRENNQNYYVFTDNITTSYSVSFTNKITGTVNFNNNTVSLKTIKYGTSSITSTAHSTALNSNITNKNISIDQNTLHLTLTTEYNNTNDVTNYTINNAIIYVVNSKYYEVPPCSKTDTVNTNINQYNENINIIGKANLPHNIDKQVQLEFLEVNTDKTNTLQTKINFSNDIITVVNTDKFFIIYGDYDTSINNLNIIDYNVCIADKTSMLNKSIELTLDQNMFVAIPEILNMNNLKLFAGGFEYNIVDDTAKTVTFTNHISNKQYNYILFKIKSSTSEQFIHKNKYTLYFTNDNVN